MLNKNIFELGLFAEKRMVFKVGGPEKGPEKAKTAFEKGEAPDLQSVSELLADVKDNLIKGRKKLESIKSTDAKTKESVLKATVKLEKIQKRIDEIQKKIDAIYKKKEKATQAVIVKFDKELRAQYSYLTGKKWERPKMVFKPVDMSKVKASPEKSKTGPGKGKETKEKGPEWPNQKLSKLLTKLLKEGGPAFDKAGPQISKLVKELNLKPLEGKTQTLDLPGGFKIAYLKWNQHAGVRPSMMIFKGPKLLTFRTQGRAFQYAHELDQGEAFSYTRRMAELVKSNIVLDKALSSIFMTAGGRLAFRTPSGLKNFQSELINLARFTAPNKATWTAHYPTAQTDVSFRRVGGGHAFFTIKTPQGVLYFHTKNKDYIGFPDVEKQPGEKKGRVVGVIYWKASDFNLTKAEKIDVEKKEKTAKEKARKEQEAREKARKAKEAREKEEAAKRKMIETMKRRTKEKAEKKSTITKLLNPKFKDIVKFDKDNPYKFKLDAGKNRKAKYLINNTRIDKFLALKSVKDKEVRVKLIGPKGVREGVYKPGDRTCYLVENGNKTRNRLKFYDQDTFEFSFKSLKKEAKK